MDVLNQLILAADDGYISGCESHRSSQDLPPLEEQLTIVDVDTDIAIYNQKQLALYYDEKPKRRDRHTLDFFPPHSNDKPRTSQEIQRLKEYSQALYHTHSDFQSQTRASLDIRASHLRSHHPTDGHTSDDHIPHTHGHHPIVNGTNSLDLSHEHLVGRFPSQIDCHSLVHPSHSSSTTLRNSRRQQSSQLLKDVALFASVDGAGYSPTKRRILALVQIPRGRGSFSKEEDGEEKDEIEDDFGGEWGGGGVGGRPGGRSEEEDGEEKDEIEDDFGREWGGGVGGRSEGGSKGGGGGVGGRPGRRSEGGRRRGGERGGILITEERKAENEKRRLEQQERREREWHRY